ncbi:response regulator [Geomonas sp. Red69]|uniref:histidine kinase n=1 Tax=Geomonas diazotrophica TaxID=2843197 RepID=A0ABX8JH34_9BACT|nr:MULTISPECIES: cache domain-containing protein [Geomonas]MBU5635241.1 response regulator [Geomonas diazotrophica]QWV97703.1 response regulator [Geomonas nitrogeniifigens]QXE86839.1 response regulator [Geomonas nitrogeniifigens]
MLLTSMKTKMTLAVFLLVGVLMTVSAVGSFLFFEKTFKQSISQQQAVLLDSLSAQIDDRIFDFTSELHNLSRRLTRDAVAHPEKAQLLLDTEQRQRAFFDNSLFLFSPSGKLVAATPQGLNFIGMDFSFREYYKETVKRGATYISPPFASLQKQSRPIIMFTVPIFDEKHELAGILGGSIDLREQHFLRSLAALKLGKRGFLSLYDARRNVLMHPDKRRVLRQDPPGTNEMLERALQGFQGTAETMTRTGIPVLRSVKRLQSTGWVLAVSYPIEEAYAAVYTARNYFVAGSLAAALLSLCLVWPFMQYLTRPLVSFTRHLEQLPAKGDLAQKLAPVASDDEIGQMARTFNTMLLELERSADFYLTLFDNFPAMIWRAGTDSKVNYFNRTWLDFTGRDLADELGDGWAAGVHAEDQDYCMKTYRDAFAQRAPFQMQYRLHHVDGSYHWIVDMGRPFNGLDGRFAGYIGTCYDVTDRLQAEEERRALEHQLTQSQKMEAIGTLTGGIAHDFNNILTAIIGYGTMMQVQLEDDHPQQAKVSEILRASERAANLTRSLLAYSRKQVTNPVPVGLNAILVNLEVMLRRLIPEHIELRMHLAGEELSVLADSGQIEQVIMNLAVNARDAMANGGILSIATDRIILDQEFVAAHGYGLPGSYALITVADTGIGMDEKTRDRIFEPFFTTKEPGKGTGLGLAMVYGIVKQHSGFINCYSEPGHGTVFRIYLPLIDLPARSESIAVEDAVHGGEETLLLVEDDAVIRDMVRELLQDFGYRVITAVDGVDAVEKFQAAGGSVALIIMDVIMPRMNGRDAYQAISALSPGVKVIFMSGYTADIITDTLTMGDPRHFVSKPIKINELLARVRELLDE